MKSVTITSFIVIMSIFTSSCGDSGTSTDNTPPATAAPVTDIINPTDLSFNTGIIKPAPVYNDDTTCFGSGASCSVSGMCGSNCVNSVPLKCASYPDSLIIVVNINWLRNVDSGKVHFILGQTNFSFDNAWPITARIKSHMVSPKDTVNAGTLCPLHHTGATFWFSIPTSAMH